MANSLTETIAVEIGRLLMPLKELNDGASIAAFIRDLGWAFDGTEVDVDLDDLVGLVETLAAKLLELAGVESEDESRQIILELADLLPPVFERIDNDIPAIEAALNSLPDLVGPSGEIALEIRRRFVDYLLYEYVRDYRSRVFAILHLLGIFEIVDDAHSAPVRTVQWERIPWLFADPMRLADDVYQWQEAFNDELFLTRLEVLTREFLLPGGVYRQSANIRDALGRMGDAREIRIPLLQHGLPSEDYFELDVNLSPLRALPAQNKRAGLALYPYVLGALDVEQDVGGSWKMRIRGDADFAGGFGVKLRAPHALAVTTELFSADPLATTDVRLEIAITKSVEKAALVYIFGSEAGSHLGFKETGLNLIVALRSGKEELAVECEVKELTLAITSDQADGFVQTLVSGIHIETSCDLVLGYSNLDGVYFRGSGALEIEIPIHQDLGPIRVETILIGMSVDDGFRIMLATSLGFELGPIVGSVDRIGLQIPFSFPSDTSGNYGPVQVDDIGFLSPTAVGFGLDTSVIVGGGFLDFDDENKRYSGSLALKLGDIGITAIGLITTRMPDGSEGFSMLVSIGITFDPAIQIYLGFTLAGVGGLIGISRAIQTDVLRDGLKKGTLDAILFPDPTTVIANAPQIISEMRAVFPPEEGRFVIGPMLRIGWGTPTIITGELGVFVEFTGLPEPQRFVLMGQVEMALPDPEKQIVGVQVDILGILDLEKKELSFQASLYASSLMAFEMWGDFAFLLSWDSQPQFGLAIGGFHPKFPTPPPPDVFADLRRLGVNINYGPVIQLQCGGYLAVTPNSFQFGARVGVFVGLSAIDVGISGFITFDALIIFSPFSFEAGVGGGMTVSVMGATLADIRVSFTLSGPTPWNMRGVGTVHVLFFEIDIDFNETWGRDDQTLPTPVDPWPALEQALQRAENWGSRLPAAASLAVSLRDIDDAPVEGGDGQDPPPAPLIVHPAGALEVRQTVAPLEVTLAKFGNAPVKDHDRFRIIGFTTAKGAEAGDGPGFEDVDEFFARGQFEDLANHEKLSLPSFERMPAGVTTHSSSRVATVGARKGVVPTYDTTLIRSDRTSQPATEPAAAVSKWSRARCLVGGNAARRCGLRAQGRARFAHRGNGMVGTIEDTYVVVDTEYLRPATLDARVDRPTTGMTRTQADQALAQHLSFHPDQAGQLMVIPECEVER